MLKIDKFKIQYKTEARPVFSDLHLKVKKGEVVAIMGKSGCGKTTILNFIQGINLDKVLIEGIFENTYNSIRTVFQEPRLLNWKTVTYNILFGLDMANWTKNEIENKSKKLLNLVGLENVSNKLPNQLSIGMKQRVNFARALACEPDLLLMDEPFSSLDKKTKIEIMKEFKKIIKKLNLTVIFVTHNKSEADYLADRVIDINEV